MPLNLNTLTFRGIYGIRASIKQLRVHQRRHLRFICFERANPDSVFTMGLEHWYSRKTTFVQFFPALERFDILVHDCFSPSNRKTFEEAEIYVRRLIESLTEGLTCEIVVKGSDLPMESYYISS